MGGYPVDVTKVSEHEPGGLHDPSIPQVCTAPATSPRGMGLTAGVGASDVTLTLVT